jgi:hypothetical protein
LSVPASSRRGRSFRRSSADFGGLSVPPPRAPLDPIGAPTGSKVVAEGAVAGAETGSTLSSAGELAGGRAPVDLDCDRAQAASGERVGQRGRQHRDHPAPDRVSVAQSFLDPDGERLDLVAEGKDRVVDREVRLDDRFAEATWARSTGPRSSGSGISSSASSASPNQCLSCSIAASDRVGAMEAKPRRTAWASPSSRPLAGSGGIVAL